MTNIDHSRIDAQWKRLWSKLLGFGVGFIILIVLALSFVGVGGVLAPVLRHLLTPTGAWVLLISLLIFVVGRDIISARRARQEAQEEAQAERDTLNEMKIDSEIEAAILGIKERDYSPKPKPFS